VADIFVFHIARWARRLGFVLSEDLVQYTGELEKLPALERARQREQQAAENAR
ncbi:glutathione S-transferase family protein, partial [Morganella morganii]|nr:glutathione S-transferase family protein [Morganella morganii]